MGIRKEAPAESFRLRTEPPVFWSAILWINSYLFILVNLDQASVLKGQGNGPVAQAGSQLPDILDLPV